MIDPGKRVTISLKNDRLTGTVLPRSDLQSKDTVTLKLDSGYNVGIATSRITDVTYHESTAKSQPVIDLRKKPGLPTVGVVSCGGTIVSRVDYSTGGVVAQSDPKFILSQSSLVGSLVNIGTVTAPVSKDSSQLEPDDWKLVAHDVHKQLVDESVSGVVVFSGTDSLHYLTAALSFMLKHINKPVVVVYSHRSTDRASTDSFGNIDAALRMTQSGICCVMAVGHATSQEGTYYALRGTTLRKMHTSRRDGFRPINDKPIAVMNSSGIVSQQQVPWNGQTPLLQDAFERKIGLIHYAPGMSPDILRWHIREG